MTFGNVYVTNGSLYKPKYRRIVVFRVRRTPVRVALKVAKQDPPPFREHLKAPLCGAFFYPPLRRLRAVRLAGAPVMCIRAAAAVIAASLRAPLPKPQAKGLPRRVDPRRPEPRQSLSL